LQTIYCNWWDAEEPRNSSEGSKTKSRAKRKSKISEGSGLGWPEVIANMAFLNVWCGVIPLAHEVSHFTVLFGCQPSSIWVIVAEIPNEVCYFTVRHFVTEFYKSNGCVAIKVVTR
jgi:hypothetical protein